MNRKGSVSWALIALRRSRDQNHAVRADRGTGSVGLDCGRVSCYRSADDKFAA